MLISRTEISAQSLSILSPRGGEKWEASSTHKITWQSSGIQKVKIEYSYSNGISWRPIVKSFEASIGEYTWTIPNSQVTQVLVKISDADNPQVYDIIKNFISIIKTLPGKPGSLKKILGGTTKNIWPLGDSITDGDGNDTAYVGYRQILFNLLTNAGYDFSFVGTKQSGLELLYPTTPPSVGDPNYSFYTFGRHHEGWGGWSAYNFPFTGFSMYHHVNFWYDTVANIKGTPPDIVLLHIGTNDIGQTQAPYYDTPAALSYQLHLLLNRLNTLNPNMTIFVAQIINRDDTSNFQQRYQRTHDFNLKLQTLVTDTLIPAGRKIVLVNMEAALNYHPPSSTDLADGIHPNAVGYNKMANTWFNSIQNYFQPVLASPSNGATNQPINLTLTWTEPPVHLKMTATYDLQVSTDINFSNIVFENPSISSNSIQPTGLKYGTQYFWRVKIPSYGWSSVRNFTTEPMQVFVKVFLQGPYSSGVMNTTLQQSGLIPNSQPYSGSPWNYSGSENAGGTVPAGVVDWVLVELRTGTASSTIIARHAVFLNNNGTLLESSGGVVDHINFYGISPGNYYIVIRHRNHLAIMSANAVTLPNSSAYDFTTDSSKYFGTNGGIKLSSNIWGMIQGDPNGNGSINATDYLIVKPSIGVDGYQNSDCNLNGSVNATDYLYIKPNIGIVTQVP